MGRTKSRNRSEIEYLQGEIRSLKKEIKRLRKREHMYDDLILEIQDSNPEIESKKKDDNSCPECSDGHLKFITILDKTYIRCDTCEYKDKHE